VLRFTTREDIELVRDINIDSIDHFLHVVGDDGEPRQDDWTRCVYIARAPHPQ
jgi:hypothetical protein